jgi:hypothetical protein
MRFSHGRHAATSHEAASPGDTSRLATLAAATSRGAGPLSGMLDVSRRKLLISGGALAAGFAGLDALRNLAVTPVRVAVDPATASLADANGRLDLPDIQFNLAPFSAPAVTINGVLVSFPPVFTLFATAALASTPSKEDQDELAEALDQIEKAYQFAPQGVFTFVSYGLPYFNRFPAKLFQANVPRLLSDESRFALEEAVPSPTDVSPGNPGVTKQRYNVPVVIEANDLLFTLRSDNSANLQDVLAFLSGSDMLAGQKVPSPRLKCGLTITSTRLMFAQQGFAARRGGAEQPGLRRVCAPKLPDVDGLRRPAGRCQRPGGGRHVRRCRRDPSHDGQARRLLRQRVDAAPVPRHPGHAPVVRPQRGREAGRGRDVPRARPVHVPV